MSFRDGLSPSTPHITDHANKHYKSSVNTLSDQDPLSSLPGSCSHQPTGLSPVAAASLGLLQQQPASCVGRSGAEGLCGHTTWCKAHAMLTGRSPWVTRFINNVQRNTHPAQSHALKTRVSLLQHATTAQDPTSHGFRGRWRRVYPQFSSA